MGNSLSGGGLSAVAQVFPPKPKWTAKDIPDLSGKVVLVTGTLADAPSWVSPHRVLLEQEEMWALEKRP